MWQVMTDNASLRHRNSETIQQKITRNRKHRRAAAQPAACAPNAVNTIEQGKQGGG